MINPWFEPNFTDEEEEEIEFDSCMCNTCKETFQLLPEETIDKCPLCNIKFDHQD